MRRGCHRFLAPILPEGIALPVKWGRFGFIHRTFPVILPVVLFYGDGQALKTEPSPRGSQILEIIADAYLEIHVHKTFVAILVQLYGLCLATVVSEFVTG